MIQNIKVDLVYYKTNTDFEMEFNLCGCCRMRLLNDKTSDRKTFLHSLARAVSRSKIIMIVGPLFGEDGITELTAGALSSESCVADNKTYGIKGGEEIRILKGSTPLVTPEGYFGGCIIESGPQTMILISDNKNIRKSIMQSLIHPYIEEVATGVTTEKSAAQTEEEAEVATEVETETTEEISEEALSEDEEIISEQEISDDNEELPEEEEEIVMESPEPKYNATNNLIQDDYETETDDDTEFITEITPPPVFNFSSFANDEDEDDFVAEDDYTGFRKPADVMKSLNISILILVVAVALLLIILCYCIFYVPSKDGIDAATYIREIFNSLFV